MEEILQAAASVRRLTAPQQPVHTQLLTQTAAPLSSVRSCFYFHIRHFLSNHSCRGGGGGGGGGGGEVCEGGSELLLLLYSHAERVYRAQRNDLMKHGRQNVFEAVEL